MARWQGFRELKTERAPLAIRPEIGLTDEFLVALLILERQAYSGAVAHYHAFFDFQIEFCDFGDAQVLESFRCGLHGVLGRVLPRLGAGPDQFDDFVDALGHAVLLCGEAVGGCAGGCS